MRAAHERHRNADKAIAGGEFEQEAVLRPHDFIEGEEARQRARDQHGDDDEALRLHAGVGGGGRIGAEHAQLITERRVPQK